ncbi:ferrous iron transporter B [Treponema sp.]|jgi:ferrous iron transport protein B|uniref:ferrous iron transporter B n=1 Tax=Treponema sp. TaxID=166 RepID=UPI002579BA16|nr:ferrous iron transporter B [Treponema sp.]MBE6355116.1 ferrous iron transporter B [Treponema sp.]
MIKIALAGNPNAGKTTLFNALTGSNQFVGNWPGVTVEKKEGKLKGHNGDVVIMDLPGIYSLSPYTLEEVVSREYLVKERPDAILNIVDGTNLERNLYLTTQLAELGIPMVVAVNMMDIVKKNGDKIHIDAMSEELGCPVVEISALKGNGCMEAAEIAVTKANEKKPMMYKHRFEGCVEHALAHIEEAVVHDLPAEQHRWYSVKLFERDEKVIKALGIPEEKIAHIESDIKSCEDELDDDSESIITAERYKYIESIIKKCVTKKARSNLTTSDKIDRVVTNRWLALPIFAVVMWLVYYVSMVTVGAAATDWANDGLFGDGFHLFGIGGSAYEEAAEEYGDTDAILSAFVTDAAEVKENEAAAALAEKLDPEAEDYDGMALVPELEAVASLYTADETVSYTLLDDETMEASTEEAGVEDYLAALDVFKKYEGAAPDPASYGVWVPGVPVYVEMGLDAIGVAGWLKGLILDGIVAGVGAVLGFVPQMLVLFIFLAFLEACGYMARIAFIMDRIFRRFGLSGKSFIPMLVGTGCGIPGIMASRTIENERDRRMTIMTTTFIPCGAKTPFIAMVAGAIFGGSPWIATSAYFIGIASIICSGIMLKKTKPFLGEVAPFVMELPAYHMPTVGAVLRSMWERGWSFIKKAGTIILISTIVIWFLSFFGWVDGKFMMLEEEQMDSSILAKIGSAVAWIFSPLGWGNWQATVASVTGLVAKENIVGTMGILYGGEEAWANLAAAFTGVAGMSFLVFNLLCAPCFAAIGAIKREMNNIKWTWAAIGYQCCFAYAVALCINQIGLLCTGHVNVIGLIFAVLVIGCFGWLLFRPVPKAAK